MNRLALRMQPFAFYGSNTLSSSSSKLSYVERLLLGKGHCGMQLMHGVVIVIDVYMYM